MMERWPLRKPKSMRSPAGPRMGVSSTEGGVRRRRRDLPFTACSWWAEAVRLMTWSKARKEMAGTMQGFLLGAAFGDECADRRGRVRREMRGMRMWECIVAVRLVDDGNNAQGSLGEIPESTYRVDVQHVLAHI